MSAPDTSSLNPGSLPAPDGAPTPAPFERSTAPLRWREGPPRSAKELLSLAFEQAVALGMRPTWCGWRFVREQTLDDYFARGGGGRLEVIHEARRANNPLPRNVDDISALPDDPAWFHYAFRDVPTRLAGRTARAELEDCLVVAFHDRRRDSFWPTLVTQDQRALALREMRFRRGHGEVLRRATSHERIASGTWFAERVYDNHSHWLTAHLPKLCLLKERGELGELILPARRTPVMDASLNLLGIDATKLRIHDASRPLHVSRLTVLETDRFRPELLQPVRRAFAHLAPEDEAPTRRVFISRRNARIRRLLNEDAIGPTLARFGFEHVRMEELDFEGQIRLMAQTQVLLAPHGAGLTNMMFCRPGAHVVEIADTGYPNPNFYALACAMDLNYWMVPGQLVGDDETPQLDRDLFVDEAALARVLEEVAS